MFNFHVPRFDSAQLEAVCRVLGDTVHGLKGEEIGYILAEIRIADTDPGITKWKRTFNALARAQNDYQAGNHTILLINNAMTPARNVSTLELFDWRRDGLNVTLAFAGFGVNRKGQVIRATVETTVEGARARAGRLHATLESRGAHPEVFRYCRAELMQGNYFHAVFEAVKGLAERRHLLSSRQYRRQKGH
jgi:hypothetical protein